MLRSQPQPANTYGVFHPPHDEEISIGEDDIFSFYQLVKIFQYVIPLSCICSVSDMQQATSWSENIIDNVQIQIILTQKVYLK